MTSKGHIYMIWTPLDNSFCYIGSTFNRLHKRFKGHKYDYKHKYGNFSIHKYFDVYGVDNFKIDLIKTYDVIREHKMDYKHLHAYETLWINKTKNCVNSHLPFNPTFNKKDCKKKYYQENKEQILEQQKNYYQENKDKIKQQYKKYRDNNKNYYKNYNKNYYQENKDKLLADMNQKVKCECGASISKCNLNRHLKTKKHLDYINNLDNTI